VVDEVSDDKNLKKMERKRLQIEHAPHASYKAKLIKLADKLYNLKDLKRCTHYHNYLRYIFNFLKGYTIKPGLVWSSLRFNKL
jgi:guanosine-3',5'-bis(diphosphate) 3'-pyrophosphohydrolase